MKTHDLKIWPQFYSLLVEGLKPFEIRRNDRDFNVGDVLLLREWTDDKGYTGQESYWHVTYILYQAPGLLENHCILGLFGPWGIKYE